MCEFYCVPLLVDFFMPCKGGSIISNIGVPLMDLFLTHADFISCCYTKKQYDFFETSSASYGIKILAHVYAHVGSSSTTTANQPTNNNIEQQQELLLVCK